MPLRTIRLRPSPVAQSAAGSLTLQVQLAESFWQKMRGLAWRQHMPADGLLFEFKKPAQPAFWMLGMRFGLDILWISPDFRVTGWVENLQPPKRRWLAVIFPWRLPIFKSARKIAYALEIPAGKRQEWRIDENTILEIPHRTTRPNHR